MENESLENQSNHITNDEKNNIKEDKVTNTKKKKTSWWIDIVIILALVVFFFWYNFSHMPVKGELPAFDLEVYRPSGAPEPPKNKISNDDLKGKPSLILFWAPWCKVCKTEASTISDIYESKKDEINVYTIVLDWENKNSIQKFIDEEKLSAPVLLGSKQIAKIFDINSFPTMFMVGPDGKIWSWSKGYTTSWGIRFRLFFSELIYN